MSKKIGLDLDNTIISYDKLIFQIAKKKYLFSNKFKNKNKDFFKKEIIKKKNEKEWTSFQSLIYGKYINRAKITKNFYDSIFHIKNLYDFHIVSHKTKWSKEGKKINLIRSAKEFLRRNHISFCKNSLIKKENIYFEDTIKKKIKRINKLGLNFYIDDLKKILTKLPKKIHKIYFNKEIDKKILTINDWQYLQTIIFKIKKKNIYNALKIFLNSENFIIKILKGGTNNSIYTVYCNKKKYILKLYESSNKKKFKKELLFLKSAKKANLNTPDIILNNDKYNFILLEHIKGSEINKPSNDDIKNAAEFIVEIQKNKKFNLEFSKINNNKKKYATDNLISINNYKKKIEKQIKNIKNNCDKKYKTNIILILQKVKDKLRRVAASNYVFPKVEYIISPSDFTFRNILKFKRKLFFFDFEYSGMDHPYKLINDFLCQPNSKINKLQSKLFISIIKKKLKIKINNSIFFKINYLTKLKWILILLNCYLDQKNFLIENLFLRKTNLNLAKKKLNSLKNIN
jgi:hypothetical protein